MKKNIIILGFCVALTSCINTNQKTEIRVGAVLPLTGNIAFLGESAKKGLDFAEYYIENLDTTIDFKIIYEDGQGIPAKSIGAYRKLVDFDNVKIVFSTISAVDMTLIPYQEKDSILYFSHSSHPKLSGVNDLFFRHSQTVNQEADLIYNHTGLVDISVCIMNDDYGLAFEDIMKSIYGDKLKLSLTLQRTETNFSTIAKRLIDSNPEKVIICAAGQNLSSLIIKLREMGFNGEIITTIAYTISGADKASKDIKNLTLINFKKLIPEKIFEKRIKDYQEKYGIKLETSDFIFFNSAYIIYLASENDFNPKNLAKSIRTTDIFNVLGGEEKITQTNDILPELVLIQQ